MMTAQERETMSMLLSSPIQFPIDKPYSYYEKLRRESPIYRASPLQWVFTEYDDAISLLQNPLCSHWGQDEETQGVLFGGQGIFAKTLFAFAPDANLPYRKKIIHGLAAKNLRFDVGMMNMQADELLHDLKRKKQFDFMRDYAHPYTFSTISRIIGVPEKDVVRLVSLVSSLEHGYFSFILNQNVTGDALEFINNLRKLIKLKQGNPDDDLCSALVEACQENDDDESFILSLLMLLFYAGHDNMMNFLGNAIYALHEQQLVQQELRLNPEKVDGCIDELLRYDSPVQFFLLFAKDDIPFKGKNIRAGSQLLVCIGAANRDPKAFENPDQIVIGRKPAHLSYGAGAYRCIGAKLAQMQASIGIRKFIELTNSYTVEQVKWRSTPFIQRGPTKLMLKVDFK
jgi:cytochrome P450